ncbi:uncharacterized protein LOC129618538 [Condylostylus longicornis]|uniref:uncharacterized protein LOC129618538 n=1 Tax=Condylostylus longicornis TaxID=2530218 RepID=UPI00244E1470|nr:uncharacterized protein LOC129618538 [Condylostylus longicornis]
MTGTLRITIFILHSLLLKVHCQICHVPQIDNSKVEAICFNWKTTTSSVITDENGYTSTSLRSGLLEDSCIPNAQGIILRCKIGYQNKKSQGKDSYLNLCYNGTWKYEINESNDCESLCDKLFKEKTESIPTPLLLNAKETGEELPPWHVAVYKNSSNTFEQICGGTIIHSNIIVSAGHCFYDYATSGLFNSSKFSVGAGKRYRQYVANEPLSQFALVKRIFVPATFQPTPLRNDIAVLVLDRHFKYNPVIAPVCLDWEISSYNDHYDSLSAVLYGWGHTSSEEIPSTNLLKINLRTIENVDCRKLVDRKYAFDISSDRFCAVNKDNATACGGDSGGGLITVREEYKLTGIVSVGVHKKLYCTNGFVTVFTKVRIFRDFIRSTVSQIRNEEQNIVEEILSSNKCLVPEGIDFKKIEILCYDTKERYNELLQDQCSETTEVILTRCQVGYANKKSNNINDYLNKCVNGKWENERHVNDDCQLICGKNLESKISKPVIKSSLRQDNETGLYTAPWNVAIYKSIPSKSKEHVCSGSIVHSNAIISAAQCFYDIESDEFPEDLSIYSITAGNYIHGYEMIEQHKQFAHIKKIYTFGYSASSFRNNIAVVALDRHLQYSSFVEPVCINWNPSTDFPSNYKNIIGNLYSLGATSDAPTFFDSLSIKLEPITNDECKKMISKKNRDEITYDRFCAVNKDNSTIFIEDTGSGLVLENKSGVTVFGVLSHKFNQEHKKEIIIFTDVQFYQHLIKTAISKSRNLINDSSNDANNSSLPKCLIPTGISNKKIEILCYDTKERYNELLQDQCSENTEVMLTRCQIGYASKSSSNNNDYLNICVDGKWKKESQVNDCELICGQNLESKPEEPATIPLVYKGEKIASNNVPWHVAIYKNVSSKFVQICGGSIVHSNVVISAAHCCSSFEIGMNEDVSKFSVGAGKRFQDYEMEEQHEQFALVKEIYNYGFLQYPIQNDIAVIALDRHLQYSSFIEPVCIDWSPSISFPSNYKNIIGYFYGWGATSPDIDFSFELLKIKLEPIPNNICRKMTKNFKNLVTPDRFCTISENNSTICARDSGGGLVFENDKKLVTLIGIGSIGLDHNRYCSDGAIGLFTDIKFYQHFIKTAISKSRDLISPSLIDI